MDRPENDWDQPASRSELLFHILAGSPLALWSPKDGQSAESMVETMQEAEFRQSLLPEVVTKVQLSLEPGRVIVIGRSNGYRVPYLDPAHSATTIVPATGQSVLLGNDEQQDRYVSRAHFMLQAAGGGILFTNGVPARDGGIRPPTNPTMLVSPRSRQFEPAEEFLILPGESMQIRLPNGSLIHLGAG